MPNWMLRLILFLGIIKKKQEATSAINDNFFTKHGLTTYKERYLAGCEMLPTFEACWTALFMGDKLEACVKFEDMDMYSGVKLSNYSKQVFAYFFITPEGIEGYMQKKSLAPSCKKMFDSFDPEPMIAWMGEALDYIEASQNERLGVN